MAYYKALGKKIVFTAHNVNAGKRDGNDSLLNRLTLQIQYRLADHIFVHTEKMKAELLEDFKVRGDAVTVIPFGINNSVPDTEMTPVEAKRRLGIGPTEKTILFFGAVRPYKGLEFLLAAFNKVMEKDPGYRLIVAGELKKGSETYSEEIRDAIATSPYRDRILDELKFIPDEETELYFKAADVSALPYTLVFQSGVLFLSYSFGLPAIASNVGSFAEDIVKGDTGFVCEPCDAEDLAKAIETYFESDLYQSLDGRRQTIRAFANAKHSWEVVGGMTRSVYAGLLEKVS